MTQRGFTLVELLVVLAILAALTLVAVSSVDVYQDQARYEATQRTLQNVEDAVLGPANQRDADGSPLITGFVADMGRLPRGYDINGDGKLYPQELWENPKDSGGVEILSKFQLLSPADDPEVRVMCGWRGPYLRLAPGQKVLNDGWGNPFDLLAKDRSAIVAGNDATMLRSRGADYPTLNTAATQDYNEELFTRFVSDSIASYPSVSAIDNVHASPLAVNVTYPGNPSTTALTVIVRYYGPDGNIGTLKTVASASQPLPAGNAGPLSFTLADSSITVGPRMIRAYCVDTMGVPSGPKSQILRVNLRSSGNSLPDLVLK